MSSEIGFNIRSDEVTDVYHQKYPSCFFFSIEAELSKSITRPWRSEVVVSNISWMISGRVSASDSTAMQIDYNLADGAMMNLGASVVDAVFGNGSYCEGNMGADKESISYRIVGGASYSNINNSKWSMSPSFAWSEDISGYGPSSLGGFTEGRQSLSLGLGFVSGNTSVNLSYVDQLGDDQANTRNDMDTVSASVSHSF